MTKTLEALKQGATGSPKTSGFGVAAAFALVWQHIEPMFDEDPSTVVDWHWSWVAMAVAMVLGGMSARDNDKTSESANAK